MGEVYRARDTKLDRDVALKILPEAFASDHERLARFEREAKTLASLNHPHIAQIHGFEESGGVRALVMEFVAGEDIAERIARGRIPVAEALPIAQQIAEALEAAHERGIVHRDLKPANVKVRPDGTVKVLDFGLAKALQPTSGIAVGESGEGPHSSTITAAMTLRGAILGTAAYMAPEQATGKSVDRRADIWAFGCVLYEMLTGQRAFAGDDLSETLASVLSKDVDWSALPSDTPSQIRSLLRRCLQRNVRERLRDIGDAYLQVRDAISTPEGGGRVAKRSRLALVAPWAVAAAGILAALGVGLIAWRRPAAPAAAVTRFIIEPPKTAGLATSPVLAADGKFVLYTADRLYLQSLSELEPRALPATENAQMPIVSPDGRWVVFYADGKLKKIAVAGGDPIAIADVNIDQPSGAWTRDNRILFSAGFVGNAPLMSVSADGGVPAPASTLEGANRESSHRWPEPLPDGRHVLFTIWFAGTGIVEAQIAVLDLQTGNHRPLFAGAAPRYAAGHLVYYRAGTYHIVRFDPATQTVIGDPQPILPDAFAMAPMGDGPRSVSVSENGTIAYRAGDLFPERAISWIHRDGREQTTSLRLRVNGFALAPDGQRLAFGRPEAGTSQIWIHDFVRGDAQRLTSEGYNLMPEWHPDGQRVAFVSVRRGYFEAMEQHVEGSRSEAIMPSDLGHEVLAWLPDGQRAIIKEVLPDSTTAVTLMPADRKQRLPLVSGAFFKGHARVSPDSRWLATCASPGGAHQLYVRPLSEAGGLKQVTARAIGYCYPLWSSRSNHLFFLASNELVAATYAERSGRFDVLKEDVISPVPSGTALMGMTADGQRFLVGKRISENPSGIRVVVNGLETLMNAPAR